MANPEATQKDGFIKWAEVDANYPLPAYAIASIRASWDVKTYSFTLEAQMAEKHTNMTQAVNHLLYLYRTDSAHANRTACAGYGSDCAPMPRVTPEPGC